MNPWNLLLNALGGALAFFYDTLPNYGIAIIALTLTVSLLLFPLTLKQTKSMRAMQLLQPEVKTLQKEHKGDREELNKQLMALYKERGVNPAAGCLPMIVQMPIWFALYRVLWQGNGVPPSSALGDIFFQANKALEAGAELTEAIFEPVQFLGMNLLVSPGRGVDFANITGSLPYIILLLIIVAAGYYQQLQMTRKMKSDPNQQMSSQMQSMQTVMKVMPIMFGFISWNLVAGLGLYFATSNIFRIGQQAVILRTTGGSDGDGVIVESNANGPADDPASEPKVNRPSQHASKKRNRRRRK
ncbi:MAG: YidC/Oxa1 family membrane protein insertase [Actinomycetota bacterium]|nr:YidC/Oxa1 family membrane protein insertase [Actinomycetota bacterium]